MRAAVLYETNKKLKVENIKFSTLQYGQVLVKIAYSGICHSQLMEIRGNRGEDKWLPHLLGHEATGIVEDIGSGITKVKVGDRVVVGWIKGDGIDAACGSYYNNEQVINSGKVTTFNEYSIVSENRIVKLDNDIPMDIGVLFGCAIPTGAGIVINEIKPKDNSTIAIFGLGGVGLSALIATKLFKFKNIIAIDIENSKLNLAKEFGATNIINSNEKDVQDEILKLTSNEGVDYSVEATGLSKIIELAFSVVKNNGGLCVFASHPKEGDKICLNPHDLISGKNIKGSWGGNCHPDRDLPKFFELYKKGLLPLEKLLEKRYKLEDINEAFNDLENRKVVRPLLEINTKLEVI